MAKKKQEVKQEPIISSIPVPPSDSALVIDLPDGQKLLVGKIETGTVIEVATWRGTGRPDSRTNRLMLGMSNDSQPTQPAESTEVAPPSIRSLKFPQNIFFALNLVFEKSKIFLSKALVAIRKIDLSKIKSKDFSLKNIKMPKVRNFKSGKKRNDSVAIANLKIEDDFDADFQRILDEVSQRRTTNPEKPPRKSFSSGVKSKSNGKKPVKSVKKSVKKSK